MKIVIIDLYIADSSPYKDPITIPHGLAALGHNVELVTTGQYDQNTLFGFPVRPLSEWLASGISSANIDLAIAISRFDPKLSPVLRAIKAAKIPLIVKGDTDGSIGYPIPPNYLRSRPLSGHPLNILRHIKWRAPIYYFVKQKIEHIQLADLVVCESPGAAINLTQILEYWNLPSLSRKITLIPNSIAKIYTDAPVAEKEPATVVSVGRWDDEWCKGSDLLAGTISRVSLLEPNIRFIVVGNSSEHVQKRLSKAVLSHVRFLGKKDFTETQSVIAGAQVLLVPSRLESFSLVSAEALCTGASLVVTPIESLVYLAGGGDFGSIARDFSVSAISSALMYELRLWKSHKRHPDVIASHWRAQLSEDRISSIWAAESKSLLCSHTPPNNLIS